MDQSLTLLPSDAATILFVLSWLALTTFALSAILSTVSCMWGLVHIKCQPVESFILQIGENTISKSLYEDIFIYMYIVIPYIRNFLVGFIFAEFMPSLKSPKIDTANDKPYCTSSLRVVEIVKI